MSDTFTITRHTRDTGYGLYAVTTEIDNERKHVMNLTRRELPYLVMQFLWESPGSMIEEMHEPSKPIDMVEYANNLLRGPK